jgi:Flp pilus assembly protein TadB
MIKFLKNHRLEFRYSSKKYKLYLLFYLIYMVFAVIISLYGIFNWVTVVCLVMDVLCLLFVGYFSLKLVKKEFDNGLPSKWN